MTGPANATDTLARTTRGGVIYALAAYLWWGVVLPLYFAQFKGVDALELLAHRVLFGLPLLVGLLAFRKRLGELWSTLRSWRSMRVLSITTVLIAINWFVFVYSIGENRLLEASFGYYINPLVSMALGFVFLGERPRPLGWAAVLLALAAVVYLSLSIGLPWISITVALSFGLYGLLRKNASTGPLLGLTVEMTLLFPILLGVFVWLHLRGEAFLLVGPPRVSLLMLLAGFLTIVPLLCFVAAAQRLQLTTMGLMQYLTPTGQFLTAIALGEQFSRSRGVAFVMIWLALIIFTADSVRHHRRGLRRLGGVEVVE